ncbi:hypothetical protein GS399_19085 [Pedobacter sp. HMF7647]|uniref:Dienelactone hydrolase domain-containing protein n=1 Tax=Hufsiella arboris TaxID=2695275 RepID=A0A7K1YF86_9SPHI|nr:dienelactone hydrolase family protein [Hufsiella arboris]MXV53080.1 hypothetical protein [Hufsiella arboris]
MISILLGFEVFTFSSYAVWFFVVNLNATIGSITILKYYYHRHYRYAFFTGIIALAAHTIYNILTYTLISSLALKSYYLPALLCFLFASILYTSTLLLSKTREKFWLKVTGGYGLVIGLILISAIVGSIYFHNPQISKVLGAISQGASRAGGLISLFFIMNFLSELRTLKAGSGYDGMPKYLEIVLGLVALITLTLGASLIVDTTSSLYWKNYNAEQAQKLVRFAGGTKTFTDKKGDQLQYILIKPQNYDSLKKYPLVICLPYNGYEAGAAELLSSDTYREKYPAFIFVPNCRPGTGWGGLPDVLSIDSLVYEALSDLKEQGIDVKRRYVTGISRGGYGTWQFICTRPDMFAAAIPICGGGNTKFASKIINLPVWAFHGKRDKNVPVKESRDMIKAIKKAGGHPHYTEFPDQGHDIWNQVTITPGLWDWLFAQKRD